MWIPPVHSPFAASDALAALTAGEADLGRLEEILASRFHAERVILTASGTHALQLALEAALERVEAGRRRVALPAYACYDLATAVLALEAPVTFYDIDPSHLGPDPDSLARALESAGVLVAANLFGYPLDWGLIRTLADEAGSVVVEDAAQGIGTMWGERMGGSQAELSVLSFGRGKGWTGSGGGALLLRGSFASADPPALLPPPSSAASMATRALAQWTLARPALYGIPARMPGLGLGETHFRAPTSAAAMHPYQARLVARSEAAATAEISFRRARATVLRDLLSDRAGVALPEPVAHGEASYLRFALRSPKLPAALPARVRRLGGYRGYPRVLPELPQLLRLAGDTAPSVPGARRLVAELLTLPVHSRTPPSGLDRRLVSVLDEILDF